MAMLLGLFLLLLVRQFVSGPATTEAADGSLAAVQRAEGIEAPDISGLAHILRDWERTSVRVPSRNLFLNDLTTIHAEAPVVEAPAPPRFSETDGEFWRKLRRAVDFRTDAEMARKAELDRVLSAAAALRVRTIVAGNDARALVDDRLVRVGQYVHSAEVVFTLIAIEPDRLLLEAAGVRIQLNIRGVAEFAPVPGGT